MFVFSIDLYINKNSQKNPLIKFYICHTVLIGQLRISKPYIYCFYFYIIFINHFIDLSTSA